MAQMALGTRRGTAGAGRTMRTALPLLLLLLALLGQSRASDGSFQRALVLDMARVLLDNYCFPENLLGMREAIEQAIRSGEILHISDRKTLAGVLSAGVQGALNDPRLTVTFEPGYVPMTPPPLSLLPREQLVRLVRSSTKLDVLDGNVGYLRLDRVLGRETAAKLGAFLQDYVWNRVARTRALILDLRYSVGGELSGLPHIVSFFSDPEPLTLIETVYDRPSNSTWELWTLPRVPSQRYGKRKDLMVLTSKRTSGAAEALAYALKHLGRAIVVGERTSGGSVRVDKIRIDSSGFYITVPVARATNPVTGQSWEVTGVSPSVSVRPKEAVSRAKALLAARATIPKAVHSVSDLIRRYYASRDKVKVLLKHLETTDFFTVISEEDLAAKLNYELQSVCEDPRLVVKTATSVPVTTPGDSDPDTTPGDPNALMDDVFRVEVRPGNTGYLRFDRFLDATTLVRLDSQIAQKVWEPIRDTDNLIIDLRSNTGGPSEGLPILLSYLHDPTLPVLFYTLYNSIQNTTTDYHTSATIQGPAYGSERNVYVLTGYHTAAAGEEFAYLMQSLRRGTVIGEITSGNLLHSRSFRADGTTGILVTVPVLDFVDNNGERWLGGGVVPDAIVLADEAEEATAEIVQFHREMRALVSGAGELLDAHYAFPEVAAKVRGVLEAKWRDGAYRSVVDYESLASQLTSDLQETSGDHRLHVFYCDVEPEAPHELPKLPSSSADAAYVVNALFKIDLLPGNTGYLRLDTMPDAEALTFDPVGPRLLTQVWSKLAQTDALVIDVRFNTGGHSSAIPLLCSFLFGPEPPTPPRHLYSVFDRSSSSTAEVTTLPQVQGPRYGSEKDVYVLTSLMTGSAAEALAFALQDARRATVVGEATPGGSLSSGMYQVGGSILYVSVPNQALLSAVSGRPWSISGVEPDVAAQGSDALNAAKRIIAAKQRKQEARRAQR
ncbi:retinol-binding protein 3-like [Alosa sapidissima]|uniref:retinol-binding protein 3-like n=1 Tax=Alosa sapidissima TaxID=34773 RepID=UPI001C095C0D|nr:retinol-binding protein 3-like [Alosa sapidissima]